MSIREKRLCSEITSVAKKMNQMLKIDSANIASNEFKVLMQKFNDLNYCMFFKLSW